MNDSIFNYNAINNMREVLQSYINNGGNLNLGVESDLLNALDAYAVEVLKFESREV